MRWKAIACSLGYCREERERKDSVWPTLHDTAFLRWKNQRETRKARGRRAGLIIWSFTEYQRAEYTRTQPKCAEGLFFIDVYTSLGGSTIVKTRNLSIVSGLPQSAMLDFSIIPITAYETPENTFVSKLVSMRSVVAGMSTTIRREEAINFARGTSQDPM